MQYSKRKNTKKNVFDFVHGNDLKRTADFRIIKQNPENGRNFPGIQEMENTGKYR